MIEYFGTGPIWAYVKVADFNMVLYCIIEGLKKATRGGVNESQSKFLLETWPISQN
jgi:hypothetical protein